MSLRTFTFQDENDNETAKIKVEIPEVIDPAYGMYVWPCAPVLAQYVWTHRKQLRGKMVLELGAGTGLPGVLAACCGSEVTLTDQSQLPRCLDNCRRSCAANGLENKVSVVGLTWAEFTPDVLKLPPFDVVLASDCFYDTKDFEDVLATIYFLLERSSKAECWVTYQERSSDPSIEDLLLKWELQCVHVPLETFHADGPNIAGSTLPGNHEIQLLVITR